MDHSHHSPSQHDHMDSVPGLYPDLLMNTEQLMTGLPILQDTLVNMDIATTVMEVELHRQDYLDTNVLTTASNCVLQPEPRKPRKKLKDSHMSRQKEEIQHLKAKYAELTRTLAELQMRKKQRETCLLTSATSPWELQAHQEADRLRQSLNYNQKLNEAISQMQTMQQSMQALLAQPAMLKSLEFASSISSPSIPRDPILRLNHFNSTLHPASPFAPPGLRIVIESYKQVPSAVVANVFFKIMGIREGKAQVSENSIENLENLSDNLTYAQHRSNMFLELTESLAAMNVIVKKFQFEKRDLVVWKSIHDDEKFPIPWGHRPYFSEGFCLAEDMGGNCCRVRSEFTTFPPMMPLKVDSEKLDAALTKHKEQLQALFNTVSVLVEAPARAIA